MMRKKLTFGDDFVRVKILLPDGVMVAQLILVQFVMVRIHVGQVCKGA